MNNVFNVAHSRWFLAFHQKPWTPWVLETLFIKCERTKYHHQRINTAKTIVVSLPYLVNYKTLLDIHTELYFYRQAMTMQAQASWVGSMGRTKSQRTLAVKRFSCVVTINLTIKIRSYVYCVWCHSWLQLTFLRKLPSPEPNGMFHSFKHLCDGWVN